MCVEGVTGSLSFEWSCSWASDSAIPCILFDGETEAPVYTSSILSFDSKSFLPGEYPASAQTLFFTVNLKLYIPIMLQFS
jgi:hypothetical protein